ncbi:MAG: error-prone DNA polymerase, partial [Acidobacteria bacterium]|nr:error-prone DNA polymerase [Acidobacteriota bacterium]
LERRLSDVPRASRSSAPNAGGDGPAFGAKRAPYVAPVDLRYVPAATPYAELHCLSHYSFLTGASSPEHLVQTAVAHGLHGVSITDRNGLYGVVRFAEAAREFGLPTVFGAELHPVVDGGLVVLARHPVGYARLAHAITTAQLAGSKGNPVYSLGDLARGHTNGHGDWWVLTGGVDGAVARQLVAHGPTAAEHVLRQIVDVFGVDNVAVELVHHGDPLDTARNDALVRIADRVGAVCVATNHVHYASSAQFPLATAMAAIRRRSSLNDIDHLLPHAASALVRSGAEQERMFARYPGVVARSADIAADCAFDLSLVAPKLPPFPCPGGMSEISYLRHLVIQGATRRYGSPPTSADDTLSLRARAWSVVHHELDVIETLGFAGYFLVVWDIVEFCNRNDILCQGRGSAANSVVCYSLGITKADAVALGLLFERFLSPERDGPPDIDIDIESGRREEVIQYVYERYGRTHAAQVANVITYRTRSAVRDAAKALARDGVDPDQPPADVAALAAQLLDHPRHLGIHSGGMVICDRPVSHVCPVEWATMQNRSVLQWDKDDCAAAGLVKFDLLGLGMLSALHNAVDFIAEHRGEPLDLAGLPQEDDVYAMLCRADTVGVFQVESRAQMATLPRLKPRRFYDLVVEVALIRPGPIQGGSVHPYIRRRNGEEPVTYLHPLLENSLGKTLGVPLFQEQLMQMAIDVAGFSAAEADQLRQAMGSKRSKARMQRLRERLYAGMERRGITGETADIIFDKMQAFANYGFPESHSVSFAYLVYASAYIKFHEPAIFCAALLNAQPMGFWSPHSLTRDARRHGVVVNQPCINASSALASLEDDPSSTSGLAVRLGLSSVRGVGRELADDIAAQRPYVDMEDLVRRVPSLNTAQLESLATAGAFGVFGGQRRDALWAAGAVAQSRPDRLAGITTGMQSPALPGMEPAEVAIADLWATGIAPNGHPTIFLRGKLRDLGVCTADELSSLPDGSRVLVAGVVTHRQRPMTAGGATFINLEDETGLINVVCSKGCWARFRLVARDAPALVVRGRMQNSEGVVNIVAEHLSALTVPAGMASRDFR